MDFYLLSVVIITSAIQSLFGVGVLLFGTPLLLILNYNFFDTLMILLPISITISFLQLTDGYKYINYNIYKNILLFSTPMIIIFIFFIYEINLNIITPIGILLILISLKNNISFIRNIFNNILNFNKSFYLLMGVIHGMTNLGGSLLSAKVFHTSLNKNEKRSTIAISYITFALFQIITIYFIDNSYKYTYFNLFYIITGLLTYRLMNKIVFNKIYENQYDKLFSFFLFLSGIILINKGIS
ncbi:MAG: TSUP family transporter [Campylobacterota bacterium]|nr:TSUP family transporter [Campylobacterota bacterium]